MNFDKIRAAKNPIFFCSFGKDSSCILHALKQQKLLDKLIVVFLDCGGLFPDIVEWAEEQGKTIPHFVHAHAPGNIWDDIHANGFPVDVEISELGRFGRELGADPLAKKYKVRPWVDCVYKRVWLVEQEVIDRAKPDLIITGERQQDRPLAQDWDTRSQIEILRPIFKWSDEKVWAYIDNNDIPLSKSFQGRQKDRRDCWLCLGGHDFTPTWMRELKDRWPHLYSKLVVDEGFGELLPAVIGHCKMITAKLEGVQEVCNGR